MTGEPNVPEYNVIGVVDATVLETVKAETPEKAAAEAELHVSVCHQCARVIEIGNVYEVRVENEDGEEVYRDQRDTAEEVRVLAKYLRNKKRLPAVGLEIVEHYAPASPRA
jgi:hypothetical protein